MVNVPYNYAVGTGSFSQFSWDSAFWVFNVVANFAYSRYCDMIVDIQKVQRELEGRFIFEQAMIEEAANNLYDQSPRLACEYLTHYSVKCGETTVERWRKLGEFLIYKYLDGNVKNERGEVTHPRYPEFWYRKIIEQDGEKLKVKK